MKMRPYYEVTYKIAVEIVQDRKLKWLKLAICEIYILKLKNMKELEYEKVT